MLRGEHDGAEDFGAFAGLRRHHRGCGHRDHRVSSHRSPDRFQHDAASRRQVAAQHHPFRIHHVAQTCRGEPDVPAGIDQDPAAAPVAFHRPPYQVRDVVQTGMGMPQQLQQVRASDQRLQTSPIATRANRSGLIDGEMPDLPSRPGMSVIDLRIYHQSRTQSGGCLHIRQVGNSSPGAEGELAPGTEVGVVVGVHRDAEPRTQVGPQVDDLPTWQDRPTGHPFTVRRQRRRQPGTCRAQVGAPEPGVDQHHLGEVLGRRQRLYVGHPHVQPPLPFGQHSMVQIGEGHPHVLMTEIDTQHHTVVGLQRHHARAPATADAGRHSYVTATHQFPNDVGDTGRRESGAARDLRLAEHTGVPHGVHNTLNVRRAKRGLRTRPRHHVHSELPGHIVVKS